MGSAVWPRRNVTPSQVKAGLTKTSRKRTIAADLRPQLETEFPTVCRPWRVQTVQAIRRILRMTVDIDRHEVLAARRPAPLASWHAGLATDSPASLRGGRPSPWLRLPHRRRDAMSPWLWALLGVLALAGESVSMALFLLYVGVAAFVAALLALLHVGLAAQVGVFVALSLLLIVLVRPRMLQALSGRVPHRALTNQGLLIDRIAT